MRASGSLRSVCLVLVACLLGPACNAVFGIEDARLAAEGGTGGTAVAIGAGGADRGGAGGRSGGAPGTLCNNGKLDVGEDCDPTLGLTFTCANVTMNTRPQGAAYCGADCRFNSTGCTALSGSGGTGSGGMTGVAGSTSEAGALDVSVSPVDAGPVDTGFVPPG